MYRILVFPNLKLVFILFTLLNISCGRLTSEYVLYGTWKGELNGNELLFKFKSDHTCVLKFFDKQSNKFEILNGNFEMYFSKKPIALSVRNIRQLNHPLHTIVEFIGSDSIILAHFSPRWKLRPVAFNRNTSMILNRIKE